MNLIGEFSIQIPTATLQPGQESFPCYIFPLVIDGPSRFVGGAVVDTTPGLHHANIVTRKKQSDVMRKCTKAENQGSEAIDVVKGGSVLFASSTQHVGSEWQRFPDGMAFKVPDDQEIIARMHYINSTPMPLTLSPTYRWYLVDATKVTREIAPFAWNYGDINLPPLKVTTHTGDCTMPDAMHIVSLLPHMHRLGIEFAARYKGGPLDGKYFLRSKGYDPDNGVLLQSHPAIDLGQGDGATFSCTWDNTLNETLGFGVGNNEMCILFGYAWPPWAAFTADAKAGNCFTIAPVPPP